MSGWTPPARFDGLRIVRMLGRGGMGAVYLAHDEGLDRPTALKLIGADEPSEALRARFAVEARALARLHHPNVVGVYRFGAVEGRPYLAYEFVEGHTLDGLGPLPWEQVLPLARALAQGIAAAHARGVVHRDLKPANIMVGPDGAPKLLDFGLAVLTAELEERALTLDGRVAGTPAYMAPERWLGEAPSPAGDVWAWAMVVRVLLSGVHPLAGLSPARIPALLTREDLPPIAVPGVPPLLCAFLDRCLARAPERRPPTGVEVRDALEALAALLLPAGNLGPGPIGRVGASLARLRPQADLLAQAFYGRLFDLAPHLRPLFPADMSGQREKLVGALVMAVQSLSAPELLHPMLRDLGRRHAAYGVRAAHFEPVGQALLGALAERDAADWDADLAAAWTETWAELARPTLAGLAEAAGGDTLGLLTQGGIALARGAATIDVPAPRLPPRSSPTPTPGGRSGGRNGERSSGLSGGRPLPSPLTRFFGRSAELAELVALFDEGIRLVTLLGMGGAGKTRLALELARREAHRPGRPVIWVPLAEARDADSAFGLVLAAIGVKEAAGAPLLALITALEAEAALLVLDNVEHLADPLAEGLAALLESCPGVAALLTSQRPMALSGELLYRVEPLPLPPASAALHTIEECAAIALLVDRIRLLRPAFRPDATNLPQLRALADRLDGIPLALELVAARVGKVPLPELIARLETDLGPVEDGARNRPARQRSLAAALRWTAERLDPAVHALFVDLSVFPGAFDKVDLDAVIGPLDDEAALDLLVEHSLLVPLDEGRYRMRGTVRAYAASLAAPDRAAALRARHYAAVVELAVNWAAALGQPGAPALTARLEATWPTLLAVVDLAPLEQAAYILGRVPVFVLWTSRFGDVLPRFARRFAAADLPGLSPDIRAGLCRAGHRLHLVAGQAPQTAQWRAWMRDCLPLPLSQRLRDGLDAELALSALERGALDEAEEIYDRLLAAEEARGEPRQAAVHADALSRVAFFRGDFAAARRRAEACAARVHALGDPQLAEVNLRMRIAIAYEEEARDELIAHVAALRALRQATSRPDPEAGLASVDALVHILHGDLSGAIALVEVDAAEGDNRRQRAHTAGVLAILAQRQGDLRRALRESTRCIADLRALLRPCDLPRPLWIRALCLADLGEPGLDAALIEAVEATLAVDGHFCQRLSAAAAPLLGLDGRLDGAPADWRAALTAWRAARP